MQQRSLMWAGVFLSGLVFPCVSAVQAASVSWSGYGTVGYARSDQDFNYQRFVDQAGTGKRDFGVGVQMDARFSDQWSATLQVKAKPSLKNDDDITASVAWAFVSWRPSNDWLMRLGRVRVPFYLNSENMDVGATFDVAQLPPEIYTTAQTTDEDGMYASKTWNLGLGELSLAGYRGLANTDYRFYLRDSIPAAGLTAGPQFTSVRMDARGLVLTLVRDDNTYRAGFHDAFVTILDSDRAMAVTFPYVAIPGLPGVGYYQTSRNLPGPGVQTEQELHSKLYTLGADVALGYGVRMVGEYVRRDVLNVSTGPDSQGAYWALFKSIGPWTAYVSAAQLLSTQRTVQIYNQVNANTVPVAVPGAALINAAQRAGADQMIAYDQNTWTIGAAYRMTATSKIKAEWARTRTGDMSSLVDALPGQDSGNKTINVLSLSYSIVF